MQWGQIKVLLIVSFLILDVYLLFQFLEKKEQADYSILEEQQSTFDELLDAESIMIPELPKEDSETYISVKQKELADSDLTLRRDQVEQKIQLLNKQFIVSEIESPIKVDEDDSGEEMNDLLNQLALYAEEYSYWTWNEELNILIYFQNKSDRPIYYNQNGVILVYLNDDNEAAYYTQTVLGDVEKLEDKTELIQPIRAIETLYRGNQLNSGDEVTDFDLGFYTRVPYEGDVQVFAPTWKVNLNEESDYFVNAIEGFVFSTEENEFLYESVQTSIEKIKSSDMSGKSFKQDMLDLLEEKLELLESGDVE